MSAAPSQPPPSQPPVDGLDETYPVLPPPERGPVEIWSPEPEIDEERTCPKCGYDMRGISSVRCPECGSVYEQAVLKRNDAVASWSVLFSFRWVVYGIAPMFLWALLAWFMLKYGGAYGYLAAVVSGVLTALGMAFWTASEAYEEHDELEGLILALAIMIGVGFVNLSMLNVLLSL